MIAVDTNILIYAHREEFKEHSIAVLELRRLAEASAAWCLPVAVIAEFLRVVTHPRVLDPPTPIEHALSAIESLMASPSCRVLSPGDRHWPLLRDAIEDSRATGNLVFDAQIVALCREYGVTTILSEDRDFRRFTGIEVRSLVGAGEQY